MENREAEFTEAGKRYKNIFGPIPAIDGARFSATVALFSAITVLHRGSLGVGGVGVGMEREECSERGGGLRQTRISMA